MTGQKSSTQQQELASAKVSSNDPSTHSRKERPTTVTSFASLIIGIRQISSRFSTSSGPILASLVGPSQS